MTTMYTPLDVYRFSNYSNLNELIIALDQGDNSSNWYRDELGHTALHCASLYGHINIVRTLIEKSDREILEIECQYGIKALSCATSRGNIECIELLLNAGAEIDDDIDMYSPDNEEDDEVAEEEEIIDCRPMIRTEVKNRRKRLLFDSFIIRYIEYNPYRGRIYNQCFPTGNIRVASPSIGWIDAQRIVNRAYLDETFFNLHMYLANFYTNNTNLRDPIIISSMSNSSNHFTRNSDKTSTLMTILTDRLKLMLKAETEIDEFDDDNNDDDN